MARSSRTVLWMVVCSADVSAVAGEEPLARAKPKVEFRRLASEPIPDVTEEKGIHPTCGEELSYLHKQPILTNEDVVGTRLSTITFNAVESPSDHFMIYFDLTKEAKTKPAAACGERGTGMLAVVIDGRYSVAAYFQKSMQAQFAPFAGLLNSKPEVERIVEAFP